MVIPLEVSRKPSRTNSALPAVDNSDAINSRCGTGRFLPREPHMIRSGEVIDAKELSETLQLCTTQAMWMLPKLWNPDIGSGL